MNSEIDKIAIIEEYIKGHLTGKTLREFEAALSTNADLRHEVELQRSLYDGIDRLGDKFLLRELEQHHHDFEKRNKPGITRRQQKMLFYGLGTTILVFLTIYILNSGEKPASNNASIPTLSETSKDSAHRQSDSSHIASVRTDSISSGITDAEQAKSPVEAQATKSVIKKIPNPIVLGTTVTESEYVYSSGKLRLFVPTEWDLAKTDLFRYKGRLLLFYEGKYYPIDEDYRRKALKAEEELKIYESFLPATGSSPKIKVCKNNLLIGSELEKSSIVIIRQKGITGKKYKFTGINIEMTQALYDYLEKPIQLIYVERLDQHFFKTKDGLYHLEKDTPDFIGIIKVHDQSIESLFNQEEILIPLKSKTASEASETY